MTRQQIAREFVHNGLNAAKITDALYKDAVQRIPFIGEKYHKLIAPYNRWLFDRFVPGLITEAAVREFVKSNADNPKVPVNKLIKDIARDTNVFYGNMGRQGIFRSATFRDLAQLTLLAPMWQEGLLQKEMRFASRITGLSYAMGRRNVPYFGLLGKGMARGLGAYLVGTQLINLVTRRQFTWQNEEEGRKLAAWVPTGSEGEGFWIDPLSVFGEVTHDLIRLSQTKPKVWDAILQMGENRMGPVGKMEQILRTGVSPTGEAYSTTGALLRGAGAQLTPSPISFATPARALGHAVAPSLVSPNPPGRLPRQLMASALGLKVQPSTTATQQVFAKSRAFMEREGLTKETSWRQQMTDDPGYAKLRSAIRIGDDKEAKRQFDAMSRTHTPLQIAQAMKIWARRPFTGAHKTEKLFISGLDDRELDLYSKAVEEKMDTLTKFYNWWGQQ
jgi:hypothetical protein